MVGERRLVAVDVAKRKVFNSLCTYYTCYASDDGTLADLRLVLEEDQIMAKDDRFHAGGKSFGKSAESHVKWASAREVTNSLAIVPKKPLFMQADRTGRMRYDYCDGSCR